MYSERVAIYIDGSNLFYKLRAYPFQIPHLTHFNYRAFAQFLAQKRTIVFCNYYIGVVRAKQNNKKGQQLRSEQQRLFAHLQSAEQRFCLKKGYIMNTNGTYHEKGVDVQLAVDLLVGAYENIYDTAILVSSDTDLIPAIKKVQYLEKKVEYIGFTHQPSYALQRIAAYTQLLTKDDLIPCTV